MTSPSSARHKRGRTAVYNSRILSSHFAARILLGILVLCHGFPAHSQDLASLEDKFAEKIISVTGPGPLSLEVENHSSLNQAEVEAVQRGLVAGLANFGGRVVNGDPAAAAVRVSLSEDLRNYVWIAEIRPGASDSSVAIISTPRLKMNVSPLEGGSLAIRKTLLWSSQDQILDVAEIAANPARVVVLYPEQVTIYQSQGGKWQAEQSVAVAHSQPWPRDLRGRLAPRKDRLFDAYLPGVFCQSTSSLPLGVTCRQSDDPWPLGGEQLPLSGFFAPAKNYFTGALSPGIGTQRSAPAFYSAAAAPRSPVPLWLFAAVDGSVHLLDGTADQTTISGWGSDIASVRSGCGSGWQVLASSPNGADDAVRAFEIRDRETVPATQPVSLSGSVSALWPASDGTSAIAVSHNREMGTYEAYRLTITCGQ
jgi:hypothetical protein